MHFLGLWNISHPMVVTNYKEYILKYWILAYNHICQFGLCLSQVAMHLPLDHYDPIVGDDYKRLFFKNYMFVILVHL
jgi:hypothetical protein